MQVIDADKATNPYPSYKNFRLKHNLSFAMRVNHTQYQIVINLVVY